MRARSAAAASSACCSRSRSIRAARSRSASAPSRACRACSPYAHAAASTTNAPSIDQHVRGARVGPEPGVEVGPPRRQRGAGDQQRGSRRARPGPYPAAGPARSAWPGRRAPPRRGTRRATRRRPGRRRPRRRGPRRCAGCAAAHGERQPDQHDEPPVDGVGARRQDLEQHRGRADEQGRQHQVAHDDGGGWRRERATAVGRAPVLIARTLTRRPGSSTARSRSAKRRCAYSSSSTTLRHWRTECAPGGQPGRVDGLGHDVELRRR